jgi:uncharacterized repeat protein (TIGR02543 family)
MGCASPAPPPAATSAPYLAFQLDVKIDPKEAATFLLNPTPLGKGGYPQGMVITIDILPKQGWQIDKWVGPVFNIDGTTAQIEMVSSQSVVVRLKLTTPPTATSTGTSTLRPKPIATPKPLVRPTLTPTPVPKLRPPATKVPKPLVRPTPVPTVVPWLPLPSKVPKWMQPFVNPTPTPEITFTLLTQVVPITGVVATTGGEVWPSSRIYAKGTVVKISATRYRKYTFSGWSGDCSGMKMVGGCEVIMDANKTVTANFSLIPAP